MIYLKTNEEIILMRASNQIVKEALELAEELVKPGVTTLQLDKSIEEFIRKKGAIPSFLGYNGFPNSICTSIDDEVVHGIPSAKRYLEEGSIVSIDIGAVKDGYHGDAARTLAVGKISSEKQKLIDITRESFFKGIAKVCDGARLGDIGFEINDHAVKNGFSTVKVLVGHGIGRAMHEEPSIPNYGTRGMGIRIAKGMTLAIEPMINAGTFEVCVKNDGWTYVTRDGQPSAHYENTIVVTADGCEVLSL